MKLLKVKEVAQIVGLSRATIYIEVKLGRFPRPRKVASKAVRWREDEILQWIDDCPLANDGDRT